MQPFQTEVSGTAIRRPEALIGSDRYQEAGLESYSTSPDQWLRGMAHP